MLSFFKNRSINLGRVSPAYVVYWTIGSMLIGMMIAGSVMPPEPTMSTMVLSEAAPDHSHHTTIATPAQQSPITALAADQGPHDGPMTHDHGMHHGAFPVPAEDAPSVTLTAVADDASGWNVHVKTENFRFAPENVNGASVPGEGHGHVYLNGEKFARLYAPHFHLADLPAGPHTLKVTLNANGHETFTVDGAPVEAEVVIGAGVSG